MLSTLLTLSVVATGVAAPPSLSTSTSTSTSTSSSSSSSSWTTIFRDGACLDGCKHMETIQDVSLSACRVHCECEGSGTCNYINWAKSSGKGDKHDCNLKYCAKPPTRSRGAKDWQCHSYRRSSKSKTTCYNCFTKEVWSAAKTKWCCSNKKIGCKGTSSTSTTTRKSKSYACGFAFAQASSSASGTNRAVSGFSFAPTVAIDANGAGKDVFWQSGKNTDGSSRDEWWMGILSEPAYVVADVVLDWHSAGASKVTVYSSSDKKTWTLRYKGKGGRCPGLCSESKDRNKAKQTIRGWRGATQYIKIVMSGYADNTYKYFSLHHATVRGTCGDSSLATAKKLDTSCLKPSKLCVSSKGKTYSMSMRTLKNGDRAGQANPEIELVFVPAQKTLSAASGIERSSKDRWVLYDGISAKVLATTEAICGSAAKDSSIKVSEGSCETKKVRVPLRPRVRSSGSKTPLLAVYAPRSTNSNRNYGCGGDCDMLARSLVDWVEDAGGRVVPLPHHASRKFLYNALMSSDGLVLPGGDWHYLDAKARSTVEFLYKAAVAQNHDEKGRKRRTFPIMGICTGMEFLLNTTAKGGSVLSKGFRAENLTVPQQFTEPAKESNFVKWAPESVLKALKKPVVLNKHWLAVTPNDFSRKSLGLTDQFLVVAHQQDRRNATFVSIIEGKHLPIFATQFHPEVNAYEFGVVNGKSFEAINHRREAVLASSFIASFLVNSTEASRRPTVTGFDVSKWDINYFTVSRTGPEHEWTYFIKVDEKGMPKRGNFGKSVATMTDSTIKALDSQSLKNADQKSDIDKLKKQVSELQRVVSKVVYKKSG